MFHNKFTWGELGHYHLQTIMAVITQAQSLGDFTN